MTRTPEERFWSRVDKSDDCWEWRGYLGAWGYGKIEVEGKRLMVHRYAYEIQNGPIPDGIQIDHACHNPACVRGEHLRLANNKQNAENKVAAQVNSRTGIRGVFPSQRKPGHYHDAVVHHGKQYYVGEYASLQAAAEAVKKKRLELFTYNDADRISA